MPPANPPRRRWWRRFASWLAERVLYRRPPDPPAWPSGPTPTDDHQRIPFDLTIIHPPEDQPPDA